MNTTTATSDNWAWYESQIDSMSEANVYGVNAFSSGGYDTALDHCQYAILNIFIVMEADLDLVIG